MRLRLVLLAGCAALPLLAPMRVAAAPACTAQHYIDAIRGADSDLHVTPPNSLHAEAALTALVSGDATLGPILQPVISDLEGASPDIADARTRLDQLAGVLALPPRSTCAVDSAPALGVLHDVYASPVFANLDQKPEASLLQRIGDAVATFVANAARTLGTGPSLAIGLLVLAAIAALVAWLVRGGLGSAVARVHDEPLESGDDPDAEWRTALAAAARGDHREAIRRAFRGCLLEVAVRGRMRVDAAWTTRELLASARGDAALLAALAAASSAFDTAWYSGRRVTAADWEVARQRCDAVRVLARRPAAALAT